MNHYWQKDVWMGDSRSHDKDRRLMRGLLMGHCKNNVFKEVLRMVTLPEGQGCYWHLVEASHPS